MGYFHEVNEEAKEIYNKEYLKHNVDEEQQTYNSIKDNIAYQVDYAKPLAEDTKGEVLQFEVPCDVCGKNGH